MDFCIFIFEFLKYNDDIKQKINEYTFIYSTVPLIIKNWHKNFLGINLKSFFPLNIVLN